MSSPSANDHDSPFTTGDATVSELDTIAGRAAHTVTVLADGRALVAGGCVVDGCTTATDQSAAVSANGVVHEAPPMMQARDNHVAVVLRDGRLFVAGGFSAEGTAPLRSAETLAVGGQRWLAAADMRLGRGGHAAALLGDGRVLVAGGWVGPRTYTAESEIYDPRRERFTAGPALPVAADGLAAVELRDGSVLVAGGQISPGVPTAQSSVITPDGRIAATGPMRIARFKHTMIALRDGRVLVIGGTSDDRILLRESEIYDPSRRRFEAGPRLLFGRYKLSGGAVLLPDDRVLVAGGGPGAEVVDLARGTSVAVPSVDSRRGSFGTVSILGDKVLLLGGYDQRINLIRRAQLLAVDQL